MKALAVAIGFLVSWLPVERATHYQVQRDGVNVGYGSGLQFTDSAIVSGRLYVYRVRATDGAEWSTWSNERSGLYLDWTHGATLTIRWHTYATDTLVMVDLPDSRWDCSVGDSLRVLCVCAFDYNGDGWITLSDFIPFGMSRPTLSDVAMFGAVYQRAARIEWRPL